MERPSHNIDMKCAGLYCMCSVVCVSVRVLCQWHLPHRHLMQLISHVANECIEEDLHNKLRLQESNKKEMNTWLSATDSWHTLLFYILILCEHIFLPSLLYGDQSAGVILRSGFDTFSNNKTGQGGGKQNDMITACLIGSSAQLHDFEYLQSHLAHSSSSCLSVSHISGPLCACPWSVTGSHSRNLRRYFRNAAQSGLSERMCVFDHVSQ